MKKAWQLALKSFRYRIGLSFSASAKRDVFEKGYTKIESFVAHKLAFVPLLCFKASGPNSHTQTSPLADLFRFALNIFDVEEALQGGEARCFLNEMINKSSEVEDRCWRHSDIVQCSPNNQLLKFQLMNEAQRLIYSIWGSELQKRLGWVLAMRDLIERW